MQLKTLFRAYCMPMPVNCGANTHRLVLNAFALLTTSPIEFCITCQGTQVFAHMKLHILSGHLMPRLEIICMLFFNDAHLYTFSRTLQLSDAFHKSPFLSGYVTLLHDDDRMQ